MPPTNSVVDDARELVQKRLAELKEERERLERALAELGGKVTRRSPGRPRGRAKAAAGTTTSSSSSSSSSTGGGARTGRKRRGRRGGTRADQAVKLIEKQPGISASDVAKTMKIKPNYLYRVLGDLEKDGRVKKDGRNYFPA